MKIWQPVAIAVAAIAGSTLLNTIPGFPRSGHLFGYLVLVAGVTYTYGRAAGLAVAALSIASAWYFALPPVYSFALSGFSELTLAVFTLAVFAAVFWMERLRKLHEAERWARRAAEEAADRLARLQTVTAALSEAVTPRDVAGVVLAQGIEALNAQAAAVYAVSSDGALLDMLKHEGYPEELVRRRGAAPLSASFPVVEAVRTGREIYAESAEHFLEGYPALRGRMHPHAGARVYVPMMARGQAIGALAFVFEETRSFDAVDREFIRALARQCAQALERSQLYAHQHRVAATLQQALLPATLPRVPGLTIDAAYRAGAPESDVGGDWYDAFVLPDGRVVLAIGDVAGRGLGAAVAMGQIRQAIRAAGLEGRAPADVLALANRVVSLASPDREMTTTIVGIVDPVASTFTYAAAGHPAPLLAVRGHAKALPSGGAPLGFMGARPAPSWNVALPPGAVLVLYTDGLIESREDPTAGQAALDAAVERYSADRPDAGASSASPAHAILDAVDAGNPRDDIAIITVAVDEAAADRLDLVVPAEPAAHRLARQALRRLAHAFSLDAKREYALTAAAGEAINNVIEHAYGAAAGTIMLRARRDGGVLRVEIADQGRWRRRDAATPGGYGLSVMRALADTVEVVPSPTGTTVRLAFALPDGPAASARAPASQVPLEPIVRAVAEVEPAVGAADDGDYLVRPVAGGVCVVEISSDVDIATVGRFTAALERAAEQADRAVVLSFARGVFFDSRGLQELLRISRRLHTARRGVFVVLPVDSPLRRLFELMDLPATVPVFESVDQAAVASGAG